MFVAGREADADSAARGVEQWAEDEHRTDLTTREDTVSTHSWRTVDRDTTRYLGFLAECGYGLSEIEQQAAGQGPLPVAGDAVDSNARADPDPDDRARLKNARPARVPRRAADANGRPYTARRV